MKNITVTVDDELYHRARICAAEQRTTVSALVRGYLQQLICGESEFSRLQREQNELIARIRTESPGFCASDRLPRADLYARDAVR
jgi:plasmid stability protein